MKRILLVAEDQLISNYHRVRFEAMGITVDAARTVEAGRRFARDRSPDLVLIDPIMTGNSPVTVIENLRAALDKKEIWVISRLPNPVAIAMEKAGASRVMGRAGALEGSIFGHVAKILGIVDFDPATVDAERQVWIHSMSEAAPESINTLRVTFHDFVKDPGNGVGLYELFRQVHQLSHRVSMLDICPLGRLMESLDSLIFDLYAMPEQINPSVVRTVSQAIDFLAVLFNEENMARLTDPASSDVCVVDDEPAARQMISAAMKLAHLKITCADDPQMALSVLGDNQFNLIFLDINMPQGSGFDLCTDIRKLEDHRNTPVVFLTGMTSFLNRAQGSLSGGNDFIGKPFNLLELGVKALMWIFKSQLAGA